MKGVEPALLTGPEGPCFPDIHLHLGVGGLHVVFPQPLYQASHCCCCFPDLLGIQGEVAGDGRAEADELLYHLKGEVVNRYAWDTAAILAQYVHLLEADGQAKLFACTSKAVDESLYCLFGMRGQCYIIGKSNSHMGTCHTF